MTRQKSRPSGEKYALKKVNGQSFFEFVAERKSNLTQNSEAELLAIAQHPCIARLVASFYTSTRMLLLTEELGTNIAAKIVEHGKYAEDEAMELLYDCARGVAHLHALQIVHRDLQPDNMLLVHESHGRRSLKLYDFGLGRFVNKPLNCSTFCGTPLYMAPGVRLCRRALSSEYAKPADMWSLGVTLYVMLSGCFPFPSEGLYENVMDGQCDFEEDEWAFVSTNAQLLVRDFIIASPSARRPADTLLQCLRVTWPASCTRPRGMRNEAQRAEHNGWQCEVLRCRRHLG